jgi:hypothetical protein
MADHLEDNDKDLMKLICVALPKDHAETQTGE